MPPVASAPVLTDGVVTLRPPADADLDAITVQSQDLQTQRWTSVPANYQRQDAEAFFGHMRDEAAAGRMDSWVIQVGDDVAGMLHLRRTGAGVVEVGFAAHPAQRGHGYMTRAVRLVSQHAFDRGDDLVLWHAWVGNFGSRKVAWAAGFDITPGTIWRAAPPRRGGRAEEAWTGRLRPGEEMRPRHRWLEPPTLEGDGVRLRAFRDEDGQVMPVEQDPQTRAYSAGLPTPDDYPDWLLTRRTLMASGGAIYCAVADTESDRLLGGIDVSRLAVPLLAGTGMVGFWLLPEARGRGVLNRALEMVLPWVFRAESEGGLGLHQVSAGCAVGNRASARVLRRAGFAPVGTERGLLQVDGEPSDELLFDLLADDDRERQRVEPGAIPVLETPRYRLRPWREDDVPGPDEGPDAPSRRFMPPRVMPDAAAYPEWLAVRQRRHDAGEHLDWCIADRDTDHALGNLTLFRLDPAHVRFQGEVGYWLRGPARGQGVVGEVLPRLVEYAFTPVSDGGLGLTRLYAETDLDNHASQRILLRAGFRRWGEDRQAFRNGTGDIVDGAYFELLAGDERVDRRPRALEEVTLDGDRVRLRPWRNDDAPRIVEAGTDPRSRHWLGTLPDPYRPEDAHAYIERCHASARVGAGLFLAVSRRDDDVCVGSIALMDLLGRDPTAGEIGYWTHPDARGQGVMTDAVRVLVAYAFGDLGRRRLVLKAAAGNPASQHVAEVNGFRRTGIERRAERLGDGTYDDLVVFDRLVSDADQATRRVT